MSKKQFEDIEDKIREAAENNQPQYQEAAWDKMNALLDKDGDKRRVPLWWIPLLLILLAGGGYWYFNSLSEQNKNTIAATEEKKNDGRITDPVQQKEPEEIQETVRDKTVFEKSASAKTATEKNNTAGKEITATAPNTRRNNTAEQSLKENHKTNKPALHKFNKKGRITTQATADIAFGDDAGKKEINSENIITKELAVTTTVETKEQKEQPLNNPVQKEMPAPDDSAVAAAKQKEKTVSPNEIKQNKINNTKSKAPRFYLLAVVGAEAVSTKFLSFNNSKFSPAYGIGIGYSITKKLSVQTGFYAGAKKYIAGNSDYHAKPGSYWNDVYIKKVDANCMIYEIPVAIRYSFLQKPSAEYFVTAGVSSYIMKKENYMYDYMSNYVPYSGRYIYTGNKHFLSVITLSAGIDKRLSQKFSLLAGPTFGIPLSGVGEGSIKLFSAGIIAGIKFQPSSKK